MTGTQSDPGSKIHVALKFQNMELFSWKAPNVGQLAGVNIEKTEISADVRVSAKQVGPDLYESTVSFRADAKASIGLVYDMTLEYTGRFEIQNASPDALDTILKVDCPTLLFPYVRRIIADMSREGGFKPLLLDPYDFAGLLAQQRRNEHSRNEPTTSEAN